MAGVSEVELAPRPTSLVAAWTFLVSRIIGQVKTPGPKPGHFLVCALEEEISEKQEWEGRERAPRGRGCTGRRSALSPWG